MKKRRRHIQSREFPEKRNETMSSEQERAEALEYFRSQISAGQKIYVFRRYSTYDGRHLSFFFMKKDGCLVPIDWMIRHILGMKFKETKNTCAGLAVPHDVPTGDVIAAL